MRHRVGVVEWLIHRPTVVADFDGLPADAVVFGRGSAFAWKPGTGDVGRHEVSQRSVAGGRAISTRVIIDVVAPHRPDLMLAMGDSVAGGHGLQRSDYLGLDDCWRGGDAGYPNGSPDS
ncbi:MAG: hypothetical protein P8N02_09475 [Actinomycetota bacterium]|nr:hypothetical protein [Actinomycetota bacterium]